MRTRQTAKPTKRPFSRINSGSEAGSSAAFSRAARAAGFGKAKITAIAKTAPTAQKGPWTKSLIPEAPEGWRILYPGTVVADTDENGHVVFSNTTGEWPEVHYSPKLTDSIAVPVAGSYLTVDLELKAATHILLFFNGDTPTVPTENQYLSLTSAIKTQLPSLRTSGDDILGGQHVQCTIPLSALTGGRYLRDDATLLFSGVKMFIIGDAGKTVTVNELSITATK